MIIRTIKNAILHSSIYAFYNYCKMLKAYKQYRDKNIWQSTQINELIKLLQYARIHSKYFGKLMKETITCHNVNQIFNALPILDKNIIKSEKENIFSVEVTECTYMANTGGSTGEPLRFPVIISGVSWEQLNQFFLYKEMGYKYGDKIVSIDGTRVSDDLRSKNIFWGKGMNFPYGIYSYSTQYLNSDTISHYVNSMNKVMPAFLRGYPSGIKEFCHLAQKAGLSINFNIKGIYLTSENFTTEDKNFLSAFFHCPVYGQYGHTECSVFAVQRPSSEEYVCSPLYGITEILNPCGEHVRIGEIGEIVVTGFSNYGMPFIRYKTGDLATYGGTTKYGEVILSNLLGRDVDYIYNKSHEKIYLVGFIFGGHIKAFNCMQSWQIIQDKVGFAKLQIIKADGFTDAVEGQIIDLFNSKDIDIQVEYVESIPKTVRGKQKFLIQKVKG